MKYKYPVLFNLYIAQSIPMSFFSTVVPVIMRQEQYSLESIGMLQLVKLPWILKFLWAPMVDNSTQTRKKISSWIISSELVYALIIIGIGFFNLKTDFPLIVGLMVLAFIASATQDIATDIFAIRILKPEEKSVGNGIQSSGSFIGSLFGTGVLLMAYHYFGWEVLMWLLAAFVLFAIVPVLLYKPGEQVEQVHQERVKLKDVFSYFSNRKALKRLLVLLFYYSGIIGILAMLKPWLVDLGYNVKEIGIMSGIVGTATAAVSALSGGYLIRKIGRTVALYAFAVLNISVGLVFWMLTTIEPSSWMIYMAICLLWGAYGFSSVVIYTTSMDVVRQSSQGTDFTVQIVITHLSSMLIAVFSGKLGDSIGYSGVFAAEMMMSVVTLLILFFVYPVRYGKSKKIN